MGREQLFDLLRSQSPAQPGHPQFVHRTADGGQERFEGTARLPPGVRKTMEPTLLPDYGSRQEPPQIQRAVVQEATTLGVGGEQDLEATVEQEPLEAVSADPSAHSVGGIDDLARDAGLLKPYCTAQARESRADDDDVCFHCSRIDAPRGISLSCFSTASREFQSGAS